MIPDDDQIKIEMMNHGSPLVGVAIFVGDDFACESCIAHGSCNFECFWIKTTIPGKSNQGSHFYIGAIYYPPSAANADLLIEHIVDTIDNIRSMDFAAPIAILSDFNDLDLAELEVNVGLSQLVNFATRKDALLDKIFFSRADLYHLPERLAPLGRSDHNAILLQPLIELPQHKRLSVRSQPYRDSSVLSFGQWVTTHEWNDVLNIEDVNRKTKMFSSILNGAFKIFPVLIRNKRTADKPWMSDKIRRLIDSRQTLFRRFGRTDEWRSIRNLVQDCIRKAKNQYYCNSLLSLKRNNPDMWHKGIKQLCNLKTKNTNFTLPGVSKVETASEINAHFSSVCNAIPPLNLNGLPAYLPAPGPPPLIHAGQVLKALCNIKPNKAGHPDEPPIKLYRDFAPELAEPVADIFNHALKDGVFPDLWKRATAVPIPKTANASSVSDLRPISLTYILARVFESFIVKWILEDIKGKLDSRQFGSRKKASSTHYLVSLIDSTLKDVEKVP
ncbi:uncharacterized protein [Antedon mediterranea]|uniref:uncharacterized protein n=1 Tax=Antedon mediterranea TaxID=105859 RepID=UPI003AFA00E9